MIKNIMVGYGGSRGAQVALSQATDLARVSGARLHLTLVDTVDDRSGVDLAQTTTPGDAAVGYAREATPGGMEVMEEPEALDQAIELCQAEDIPYTVRRFFGDPGARLVDRSRFMDLVVAGRRGDDRHFRRVVVGKTAQTLLRHCVTPTVLSDREHLPVDSATLLYEPTPQGGRALAMAGEVCGLLNITLNTICVGSRQVTPAESQEEAQFALRAYHLEGEIHLSTDDAAEAVQNAAMMWGDPLLVVPVPVRRGWLADFSTVQAALLAPNTNVLFVP